MYLLPDVCRDVSATGFRRISQQLRAIRQAQPYRKDFAGCRVQEAAKLIAFRYEAKAQPTGPRIIESPDGRDDRNKPFFFATYRTCCSAMAAATSTLPASSYFGPDDSKRGGDVVWSQRVWMAEMRARETPTPTANVEGSSQTTWLYLPRWNNSRQFPTPRYPGPLDKNECETLDERHTGVMKNCVFGPGEKKKYRREIEIVLALMTSRIL